MDNKLSIGKILVDTATGENLGVVVNIIPSTRSVLVFRVDKKVHPTFSKIKLDSLLTGGVMVNGNINHASNNDLKLSLLKYYRTRNLSDVEKRALEPIMLYAFPSTIPEYKPDAAVSAEIIKHTNLRDKIRPGAAFYMNTTENSKYPHLDNKTIWIVKTDNKGIWVCDDLKCVHQPSFTHIPYKDIDTPTFYGVSKMMESGVTTPNFADDFAGIKSAFGKLESDKTLLSQIIHDGIRMKVDPEQNNLIVTPHKYAGQCYDFNQGRVCNLGAADDVRTQIFNNEPLSEYKAPIVDIGEPIVTDETPYLLEEDPSTLEWVNKLDEFKSGSKKEINKSCPTHENLLVGGADSVAEGQIRDPDLEELLAMDSGSRLVVNMVDSEEEMGSEFEGFEEVADIDAENITEYGTVQKIRQIAVPELERTFKESILRGHIKKQKEESLPPNLRRMYQDKINKEVNMISLIKSQVTLENKSVRLPIPDYKPLAENYLMRNFAHNNFLIPLVISTRKIFLTKKDKINKDDFNTVNTQITEDYLKYINDIEKEKQAGGKKRLINLDDEIGRQTMIQSPYVTSQSNIGLLIRMGEKYMPEAGHNFDTTLKLKMDRAIERIEQNEQHALVIQYGQKPYEIDGFGLEKAQFDSFVALGPLSRFIGEEKRSYTVTELEEMEEQIDKNVEAISSQYKMYYYGDNINLVGFVRPPLNNINNNELGHGLSGSEKGSLVKQLMDEDNVIIRQLHKLDDTDLQPLDEPDKYILYLFPGLSGAKTGRIDTHINEEHLKEYLNKAVPKLNDIVELYTRTWSIDNSSEMFRLFDILAQFDYYYPSNERDMTSYSRGEACRMPCHASCISYEEYEASISKLEARLVNVMSEYSNKLDKVTKLKTYKNKKQRERKALTGDKSHVSAMATVVTDDLIELADKLYGERFEDISGGPDNMISKTDEYRLDYYAKQDPDNSRLMNLLIRQKAFINAESIHNKEKLENTLFVLKNKYESLANKARADIDMASLPSNISAKLKTCASRMDRKPKIIRYMSMDRLKEDNGKVATNTRGEVIMTGDYAVVDDKNESGAGEKKVFKREQLTDGDYWIAQPIEVLESLLLKKKRESCETDNDDMSANKEEMRAKMRLPGEQLIDTESDPAKKKEMSEAEIAQCTFSPDKLVCLPAELSASEQELRELETRIKDVKAQLDFITKIPVLQADTKQKLASVENEVRGYIMGLSSLNKYYEAKHLADQKFLEEMIKRRKDCTHFAVTDYYLGLRNLTDMEKYGLAKQIIDRFQNTEQVDTLILDKFDHEEPKNNNIECYICQQNLICKHYAYAIKLLENGTGNILEEEPLIEVYGEENCGSFYCKSCGVQIANAAVLDVEEFEKSGDKEGMHVKTREVLEEINLVEKQKQAIDAIVNEALIGGDNTEDLQLKLRIYKLLKDLCSLKMMSIDDELEMVNFLKGYSSGITKKAFYTKFAITFLKAGKQVAVSVIDKLATAEYWKYITADIMCRFLVTLQTSKQMYKVYNKLLSSDYMGWPMIGYGVSQGDARNTETDGINMLFGLAVQMSLSPDFEYLNGGSGTIEGFRGILFSRMDELIRNDELVRSRLTRSLDDKYRQITLQEEREAHITNFWPTYKPAMTFNTAVGWVPAHDITKSVLSEWSGKTLAKIMATTHENIAYQAQMLKHNVSSEIKKQQPKTRLTLSTSLGNSCCPLDFNSKVEGGIKSQSDVNYYHYLLKANESISANLNKIRGYADILHELDTVLKERRLVINMPPQAALYTDIALNINLNEGMIKDYFLKYIDIGINKGEPHLFDPFGRCLISNQLKTDVTAMNYAQSDFEKLLIGVYQKTKKRDITRPEDPDHLLDPAKYEASQLVIKLINKLAVLSGESSNKPAHKADIGISPNMIRTLIKIKTNIHSALAPKLIEEVHYEPECMYKISALSDDYDTIINAIHYIRDYNTRVHTYIHESGDKLRNFGVYMNDMLELINKSLYDTVLEYLKTGILSRDAFKFPDAKKEYFGLITKIETESQALIEDIIGDLGLSKKEESDLETFLVNMGDLKDIKSDYKAFLEKREIILARVEYANIDYETERQARLTQANMINKHIRDMRLIISHLKNRSWQAYKASNEMTDTHYVEFFKYKDNAKLFEKVYDISNLFYGVMCAVQSGDVLRVIGPDIQVALYQNLFLLCISMILSMSGVQKHKEQTLIFTTTSEGHKYQSDSNKPDSGFADRMKQKMAASSRNRTTNSTTENIPLTDMYEPGMVSYEVGDKDIVRDILDEPSLLKGDELQEFGNEPGDELFEEDDDELHVPDFATKLIKAQRTQKEILVNFVADFMQFIKGTEHVYNQMSLQRIAEEKAKTVEKQKRKNLGAFKYLRQEGMEEDYRLIQLKMSLGELDYSGLHEFMLDYLGDSYDHGDPDMQSRDRIRLEEYSDAVDEGGDLALGEEQARRNKLGLDDYEMEEMGFVGAAEDMEDMDYGYLGVDEE